MIKIEVSSSIGKQVTKIISKIAPVNCKILKSLVLPLNKLVLTEDYALDEFIFKITHCM